MRVSLPKRSKLARARHASSRSRRTAAWTDLGFFSKALEMMAELHLAWTISMRVKIGIHERPFVSACGLASPRREVSSPMSRIALVLGLSLSIVKARVIEEIWMCSYIEMAILGLDAWMAARADRGTPA